jgi:hypothetical protein
MTLSTDMNPGSFPIDIVQAELDDIVRPKSQAGKEKYNRTIPPADG